MVAYKNIYDDYKPSRLDFDIEGTSSLNIKFVNFRSQALAKFRNLLDSNEDVESWLTLASDPDLGLPDAEKAVVESALKNDVDIDGVNIMAMAFGPSYDNRGIPKGTPKPDTNPTPEVSMATNVENAATNTINHLTSTYQLHGKSFDSLQLGITPMIGNNTYQAYSQYSSKVDWNIFSLDDQEKVINFANQNNIGMLSMWPWSRDNTGTGLPAELSPSDSGIKQDVGEFSKNFDAYYKANDMITNQGSSADPSWLYSFGSSDVQAKMTSKGHTTFSFDADDCSLITGFSDRPNRLTEE